MRVLSALMPISILGLLCSACSGSHDALLDGAQTRHIQALEDCQAGLQTKRFKKRVQYAQCLKTANLAWWEETRMPHKEQVELAVARDIVLAEQFDKGRMSEAEYEAERAKIKADLFSEMERRGTNAALVRAAYDRPSISCTKLGNTTTCR